MDNKYVTFFKELAQATAASAESVMEYDESINDEAGLKTATTMRDDYQDLADRIVEGYVPNKNDSAKLLVGAMIQVNQIQDRINNLKKALAGYQTDIIPKFKEIIDVENDEAAIELANEKFVIEDNK